MSVFKKVLLVIVAMAILLGLGLFVLALNVGYWPKLAKVVGVGGVKDLGVSYADEDYISARTKLDAALDSQIVKTTLSDAELTALVNGCTASVCVVDEVQVMTDPEGTVELSGAINRDDLADLMVELGDTGTFDPEFEQMIKWLPARPSVYVRFAAAGHDDTVTLALESFKLAGIEVPKASLTDLSADLSQRLTEYLADLDGTQVNQFKITEDGLYLEGNLEQFDEESL
ncbi:MAG: hypothetical protein WAZ14_03315 [Patescibacteria group bacterium]